jgi:ABC-2 type transport system permease protein
MNAITLLRRELAGYFFSPLAWVVLALFLVVQGYSFYLFLELISQPQAPHGAVMQYFFGGTFLYWLFVIVIVSTLTMRLLAEERRSGTIETLMAAPVREVEVVVGKYLAALLFYAFLWAPTVVYVALVVRLSGAGFAWGPVLSGYLGTMVIGAACIAIGLLASALSRNQIVAALLTFAVLTLLLLLGPLEHFVASPVIRAVVSHVNLFEHMEDFARGIVDSRHLVLHGSVIVFCLAAATKALEAKKWR